LTSLSKALNFVYIPLIIPCSDVSDTPDQLVLSDDGTIKSATVAKLIQKLFDPDYKGMIRTLLQG